jgi:hypothetical protein
MACGRRQIRDDRFERTPDLPVVTLPSAISCDYLPTRCTDTVKLPVLSSK